MMSTSKNHKDRRREVIAVRTAGPEHQVVSVTRNGQKRRTYRRRPCSDCPWRKDSTGVFPAEAFRLSARTAYDMSDHTFACHQAGVDKPSVCAGFLLRGAGNNLAVRLARMRGDVGDDASDDGLDLHESYRAMAIANGVDPDDDALRRCRSALPNEAGLVHADGRAETGAVQRLGRAPRGRARPRA